MSLSLLQSYSDDDEGGEELRYDEDSDNDGREKGGGGGGGLINNCYKPLFDPNPPPSSSCPLPSAFDAFSEISGPPQFLNNAVEEERKDVEVQKGRRHGGGRRYRKDRKDVPAGAVVEAKAQLVGIHERVRSDGDGNISQGVKRAATTSYPNAEDASELLRVCLKCGVPKTYNSSTKGIVCPICGDSPATDDKKGTVKDKEKLKRMKGQSSHATWKSETEMQLRQQFD